MDLTGVLEGLLFVVGEDGITTTQIMEILEIDDKKLKEIVKELTLIYNDPKRGITLKVLGNKLKLTTKEEHKKYF